LFLPVTEIFGNSEKDHQDSLHEEKGRLTAIMFWSIKRIFISAYLPRDFRVIGGDIECEFHR